MTAMVTLHSSRARIVFRALEEHGVLEEAIRICEEAGADLDEVFGSKATNVSHARQAVWAMLENHGMSLGRIGRLFDRHHTTILAGIRAHEHRETAPDISFREYLARITTKKSTKEASLPR